MKEARGFGKVYLQNERLPEDLNFATENSHLKDKDSGTLLTY
jgi:hypothetical protein